MSVYHIIQHINHQEKLQKKRDEAIIKHNENMKKHSYRKKLKNKTKANKSKQVELNRNIRK